MSNLLWKLNTSNPGKLAEFRRLFSQYGCTLEATEVDLAEIDATAIEVIAHKASQLDENVLVEDTALFIQGAEVGIQVRWLLDHLSQYVGRDALWQVLLAQRKSDQIDIYQGLVEGSIVLPQGSQGFGFDPIFLPKGARATLAESKPDACNARAKAVQALIEGKRWMTHALIKEWKGDWQNN